jgi:uncharacterized protein (DUF2236 family)
MALPHVLPLPGFLERRIDAATRELLQGPGVPAIDFAQPAGEAALVGPDSVSWRIFKNPVSMFVGGVAAVILELAEPAVRTGVWEHTNFRQDPVGRLRRTGLAAMVTVYGPRSTAQAMIAGVVRAHGRVVGLTPAGEPYRANDVKLLTWVQATAGFGFAQAYSRFVRPLSPGELQRLADEGAPAARLYGALEMPRDEAGLAALFEGMRERLEPSPIVFEFLDIMRRAPALPPALRPMQRLMVAAAVDLVPDWIRERLGLGAELGLAPWQERVVRAAGRTSDRILVRSSPPVRACRRLGLPDDFLYRD